MALRVARRGASNILKGHNHDDGNYGKVGSYGPLCIMTTAHSDKLQVRLPIVHFRRILEAACPSHAYPVRHKLKICDMMKSFMILGSFTRGTKLDEDPGGSDIMPFPGEDAVMTVYGGHLPLEKRCVSKLSPSPQHVAVGDAGA
jgi:hypothetical protein